MNRVCGLRVGILGLALCAAGCTSAKKEPYRLTGDPVVDGQHAAESGHPQDRLLWVYRGAVAAMRRAQFGDAKQLLDDAMVQLNGMLTKDKAAKKSRGVFNRESSKTFYGEPYERAMAYYYRGILYWMDGEPDNARACFRSAQLQDSDTENKTYSGDYVLLDYLEGLASTKLGADGADAFKRSQANPRIAIPPAYNPSANVLFFVEFGAGPTKQGGGNYGEQLQFHLGTSSAQSARIRMSNFDIEVGAYDDLNFQATTRGGRTMDHVLANKARFKRASNAVGDAAIVSGAILGATSSNQDETALGLVAAGLLSKIFSAAAAPEADTRAWDNLPLFLSFAAIPLAPGQYPATIEFLDQQHQPIPALTKQWTLNVSDSKSDKVIFVSDQSTTPQTL